MHASLCPEHYDIRQVNCGPDRNTVTGTKAEMLSLTDYHVRSKGAVAVAS